MGGLSQGGIFNFLLATDTAAGQAKLNKSLVKKQRAENIRAAGEATLARWNQSLSNQKLLDNAGKAYGTISENLARQEDAQTMTKVQRSLADAEKLGAVTAAFASIGVGGSGAETYARTMQTANALQAEQQDRSFKSSNYLMVSDRKNLMSNAVDNLGRDVITANFDFTNYGPTKAPSLLGNLATLAVAAAASAAGAPQVGDAILKAKTASLQNRAGDGSGATRSFGQALDSFGQGVNQVRDKFRFQSAVSNGTGQWGSLNVIPDAPMELPSIGFSNSVLMR